MPPSAYVVLVFRRSGRWWAACSPDFTGAHSQGRTLPAARKNLLSAIEDLYGIKVDDRGVESKPIPGVVIETISCVVPA